VEKILGVQRTRIVADRESFFRSFHDPLISVPMLKIPSSQAVARRIEKARLRRLAIRNTVRNIIFLIAGVGFSHNSGLAFYYQLTF
jgi:hypothetical protein